MRQYVEECRQSDSRKTSLLNREAGQLRRDAAASNAVLITWQISFEHLRNTRESAADLLSPISFFDRQGIQEALLRRQSSAAAKHTSTVEGNDEFEDDVLASARYEAVLRKDHPPLMRVASIRYADALAKQEQGQPVIFPTTVDSSASARKGKEKESKLMRGLAKIGIRS